MKILALAMLGIGPGGFIFAQVAPSVPGDQVFTWMTGSLTSVLAGIVIAFWRGWIVAGSTHQRVLEERDKAINKINQLADEDRKLILPLLGEVITSTTTVVNRRTNESENR